MGTLTEAIARGRAELCAIHAAAEAVSAVDADKLLGCLVEVQSLQAQVDALNALLLARIDLAMLPSAEHSKNSTAAAVAVHANTNPRITRANQRRGLWILGFPVVGEAFTAGLISQAHVDAIKAVDNPRTSQALVEAQDYLVEAATDCTWDQFQKVLRYWALAADPDGEEPNEQFKKRSLNYRTNSDGTVEGRFHLDPLAGQAFTTAIDRLVQRLWQEDQETGSTRSATQRRVDALMLLITNGAANPDTNLPGALIHIVMSETVAEHILSTLARTENPRPDHWPGDRLPVDHDDIDKRCEFVNGVPVHPNWVAAAMATARFRRLIFSTKGEILEHGRKTRTFHPQAKQALLVRARGRCQEAGCDAPITWLQADHYIPWNRNGPTDITNGQILCSRHNKLKNDQPPEEDSS